jgi:hypothetical protein
MNQFVWILISLIVISAIAYIIFLLTKPISQQVLSFQPNSTVKLKYVTVPQTPTSDIVVLPWPDNMNVLRRYEVLLPRIDKEHRSIQVRIPFPSRVYFRSFRDKQGSTYIGCNGKQTVTLRTRIDRDGKFVWFIAKRTAPTMTPMQGDPFSPCTTFINNPGSDPIQFLFSAAQVIKSLFQENYESVVNGSIGLIQEVYNAQPPSSSPSLNLACMIEVVYQELIKIESLIAQQFINNLQEGLFVNINNVENTIATYLQVVKQQQLKAFIDYASGGDPNLVMNTTACGGAPVQGREYLFGESQGSPYWCQTTNSLQQLIGLITGTNEGSLTWIQGKLEDNSYNPEQLVPIILPFYQLLTFYQVLSRELFTIGTLPSSPSGVFNPWLVQLTVGTYDAYQANMITYITVFESFVSIWKQAILANSVQLVPLYDTIGCNFVTNGSSNCDIVKLTNLPVNEAQYTEDFKALFESWCNLSGAFAVDQGCNAFGPVPPNNSANNIYIAIDSSYGSYSTPFNSNLPYWDPNRTCYNNTTNNCCVNNPQAANTPGQQNASALPEYFNSNEIAGSQSYLYNGMYIDFPAQNEIVLSKYKNSVNGQLLLQNTNTQLTTPYALLCIDGSNNGSNVPKLVLSNTTTPPQNEAPADDFPIHQQTFIDKWFGRYPSSIIDPSDGPGDLDNALALLYSSAGLIPSINPKLYLPVKMPYISIGGQNFMPGTPFGTDAGTYFDSQAYVYCTNPITVTLDQTNECANSNTIIYDAASVGGQGNINIGAIVDATVDINANVVDGIGCFSPANDPVTKVMTCLLPNYASTTPTPYTATNIGSINTPQTASRILLCSNENQTRVLPAVNCSTPDAIPSNLVPYTGVCTQFWAGNAAYLIPIVAGDGRGYQMYTFNIPNVSMSFLSAPAAGTYMKITNVNANISYIIQVTATGTPLVGYPSAVNIDSQTIPLNFTPLNAWTIGTDLTYTFPVYIYMPSLQKYQLSYLNDEVEIYFM